ncbi:MAG: Rrf2 family transcriptional regulator [Sedimentisphaerales bacterium]|nr:Rrf2 family transcriptional regulator [Sedimentisphaerales bacterium]
MKLSTRTRYGIRAVVELAENFGREPVQLKVISKDQGISIKYLEQIISLLKSAGIVTSERGAKGGYLLAKPPNEIKLSECFNCLEGPVVTVECVENDKYCPKIKNCVAREVWTEIEKAIFMVLESITLQDMVDKSKKNKPLLYQI